MNEPKDTSSQTEPIYITIPPKQFFWGKPKPEIEAKTPISDPVLHDFIVSILHHHHRDVYPIMGKIPDLNNSKLFRSNEYIIDKSLQEYIISHKEKVWDKEKNRYVSQISPSVKADAIWIFKSTKYENNIIFNDVVVHEVKTGNYVLNDVFEKYFGTFHKATIDQRWSSIRLYIWAWKKYIDNQLSYDFYNKEHRITIERKKGALKELPLEHLFPIIKQNLFYLTSRVEGDM